ncbi:MAG: SDR family oxidoreductase [Bacilli bacterium]|nr:SDR family oxidoreductase [Bacilli bacterium]
MENKTVLITGASRGLGSAIALKYAKNNYNVIINYNKSKEEAQKLKQKLEAYNKNIEIMKADITNEKEIKIMVNKAMKKYKKIDVLVNNAAIAIDKLIEDKTVEDFEKTLKTNLIGPFLCSRECAKYMKKGTIINVSSTNGIDTYYPYSIDYDASKAGLISLTHNLAVEYAPNIRVNAVAPGWINTDMNKELDTEYIEKECKKILQGRFAEPEEIANVIYFLATDEAKYINNEVIRVDGGYYA